MKPISKKLTLVVGAGASREVRLPTGDDLKKEISSLLDIRFEFGSKQISGDYSIRSALEAEVRRRDIVRHDINPLLHAGWLIRDGLPLAISIDNFVDAHRGNREIELCAKLAIVRAILSAERNSQIWIDSTSRRNAINFQDIEHSWLNQFWRVLTENQHLNGVEHRLGEVSLIVFNYDRCIEHYLFHAFQIYYGVDEKSAASLVSQIEIFHPYGTVGNLPWQSKELEVPFGSEIARDRLLDVAGNIKTFSEGTDPESSDVLRIRELISHSERVLFLGFAYHRLNLELLKPASVSPDTSHIRRFFGTAKGISKSDTEHISVELANLGHFDPRQVALGHEMGCKEIFREFSREISLY